MSLLAYMLPHHGFSNKVTMHKFSPVNQPSPQQAPGGGAGSTTHLTTAPAPAWLPWWPSTPWATGKTVEADAGQHTMVSQCPQCPNYHLQWLFGLLQGVWGSPLLTKGGGWPHQVQRGGWGCCWGVARQEGSLPRHNLQT